MKTIGLIGGMSWESSAVYYRYINTGVRSIVGGNANARSLMLTLDFATIDGMQHDGDWAALAIELSQAARTLERGGADVIVLCTNTMHKLASDIEAAVSIPLLHIVDATADELIRFGVRKVGLLGTRFTMEDGFYQARMKDRGVEVITPCEASRLRVHSIIYEELCRGQITEEAGSQMRAVIGELVDKDVTGIVLGCTELCLLTSQDDSAVPLFNSTRIHAEEAIRFYLAR